MAENVKFGKEGDKLPETTAFLNFIDIDTIIIADFKIIAVSIYFQEGVFVFRFKNADCPDAPFIYDKSCKINNAKLSGTEGPTGHVMPMLCE